MRVIRKNPRVYCRRQKKQKPNPIQKVNIVINFHLELKQASR